METELYRKIGLKIKNLREDLGISQEELANVLDRGSPATISHYESGQRKISIGDLQKIASFLSRPLSDFLDISTSKNGMAEYYLRASNISIRPAAREDVANFLAFAGENGHHEETIWKAKNYVTSEEIVIQILRFVDITKPPIDLYKLCEKLNISIFDWDFPNEISGILAIDNNKVGIGVNRNHPNVRQRFTIAHELGHYFFREDKSIYLDFQEASLQSYNQDTKTHQSEMKANKFAANLLMPNEWVKRDFKKFGEAGHYLLAQRYQVSEQAMWFKLISLNLVRDN